MPAWMTSELRDDVPVPMALAASITRTSFPFRAKAAATDKPTAPAPTTTTSTSINELLPCVGTLAMKQLLHRLQTCDFVF
jgi:hypothetical protein